MNHNSLDYKFNDGGRSLYYDAVNVGDCVVRSVAIASGRDYQVVYNEIKNVIGKSPRDGVYTKKDTKDGRKFRKYMDEQGWEWIPTMKFGTSVRVHLRNGEIPMNENIICSVSGHYVAVLRGIVNDTYDCTRDGNRCVYGYWRRKRTQETLES